MPNQMLLGLSLTEWTAVVNAVTVVVLVFVNVRYLIIAKRQAEAANAQAKEGERQADAALESLRLLKSQLSEQSHRELVQAITILNEVRLAVLFWTDITKDKWGMAPAVVNLLPEDWSVVLLQAGKVSLELRKEVLEAFRMVGNAQY